MGGIIPFAILGAEMSLTVSVTSEAKNVCRIPTLFFFFF